MVALAFAASLCLASPAPYSFDDARFEKLCKPQNGYGEYLHAALLLSRPEDRQVLDYLALIRKNPQATRPALVPKDLSPSDLRRRVTQRLAAVIGCIRRGNQKASYYPDKQFTNATFFPELQRFRDVSRLLVCAAEQSLSDKNSVEASRLLLDSLAFAGNIGEGPQFIELAGRRCRLIAMRSLREHFSDLQENDLRRLARWSADDSKRATPYLASAIAERKSMRRSWLEFCNDPKPFLESFGDKATNISKVAKGLRQLRSKRRNDLYDQLLIGPESEPRAVERRLREPEKLWMAPVSFSYPLTHYRAGHDSVETGVGIILYIKLLQYLYPDDEQNKRVTDILRLAASDRAESRIAGLYAAVGRYRLKAGHLPTRFSDATGRPPIDPVLGRTYNYSISRDGHAFTISLKLPDGDHGIDGLIKKSHK